MKRLALAKSSSLVVRLLCAAALPLLSTHFASAQSSGGQDPAFAVGADANGVVRAVALQSDGQVLVGGSFTTFRGANRNSLARLHTDGGLDTFSPGLAFGAFQGVTPTINAVAVQADGKILAAGSFTVLNQSGGGGIVRLNANGTLDTTFNAGTGVADDDGTVGMAYALKVLSNGQILVGGAFVTFNGVNTAGLVRLNANGTVDTTFNAGGAGVASNGYGQDVRSIVVEANGEIVIGGHFSAYDGHAANCVARLTANGALDTSFSVGEGADDGGVLSVAVQIDGKVLVGGGFSTFDGISVPPLLRLNANGSLDTGYSPAGDLFIGEVDALLVQPDGSALAGGILLSQGGLVNYPHNGLARLLGDGTQDAGFDSGDNSRQVVALALQNDGKAVAASNTSGGNQTGNVLRYYDLVPFFTGEVALGSGVFYLSFANGDYFGYYGYLTDPHYIYHLDLGYEYVFDAADGHGGVYLYDFTSNTFFYTSPVFPFPYLYDFTLNSTLYYYPDPQHAGRYNTNGIRYFYEFKTGKIITK